MKKRAFILAMIAFIAATTSEPSINMVRAEETQAEETQTLGYFSPKQHDNGDYLTRVPIPL